MSLFHTDVYLPASVLARLPKGNFVLTYSEHAKATAHKRSLPLLAQINTSGEAVQVVEVETSETDEIVKIVYRISDIGLCFAVVPHVPQGYFLVKTCWGNSVSDNHATLDYSKYERPANMAVKLKTDITFKLSSRDGWTEVSVYMGGTPIASHRLAGRWNQEQIRKEFRLNNRRFQRLESYGFAAEMGLVPK